MQNNGQQTVRIDTQIESAAWDAVLVGSMEQIRTRGNHLIGLLALALQENAKLKQQIAELTAPKDPESGLDLAVESDTSGG